MRKHVAWKRAFLLVVQLLLPLIVSGDSRPARPQRLLSDADRFAMLYDWPQAVVRYAQAESLLLQGGDKRNAVFARLGRFWGTADWGVSPEVVEEVAKRLENPYVQSDATLLMRALA